MQVLDLFSGIGGFSIGLEKVGFETVAFCEIEPYCQAVLRKHWPDTPIYNDVRSLTAEQLRADGLVPNVIVGGYPCQPFSVAGVRRGEDDDRHLWPEVYRLVKEIRPTWGIFENVAGHITMGLDEVLSDLEAEDYAARPFVIPACGVDAPHRRDRVWIVAKNVADSPNKRIQDSAEEQVLRVENLPRELRRSGEDIGGRWPPEPNVGRVANGVSNRSHRIKALGNAVVPQVPEAIGRVIKQLEGAL
jgi:DNA (cytosine-5)-methyltransferase 1